MDQVVEGEAKAGQGGQHALDNLPFYFWETVIAFFYWEGLVKVPSQTLLGITNQERWDTAFNLMSDFKRKSFPPAKTNFHRLIAGQAEKRYEAIWKPSDFTRHSVRDTCWPVALLILLVTLYVNGQRAPHLF